MNPEKQENYWPLLISQLRTEMNCSQLRFAAALNSTQETISRWENGLSSPNFQKRNLLLKLKKKFIPAELQGLSTVINLSPFPIILTDRFGNILAASKISGFKSGKSVIEQTPPEEIKNFLKFENQLVRKGFWSKGGQCINYKVKIENNVRKAVVVSVGVNGAVYAVVQRLQ